MGRKRIIGNHKGLPQRWRFKNGSYRYVVPKGQEANWDGKTEFTLGKNLAEAHRTYAGRIAVGADQLLSTFNALLRIAKIESEFHRGEMETLDLSVLAEDVVELYEPVAEKRKQQLTCLGKLPVQADGDRDMLFQAIGNLVDNACKYTPMDGIITVETGFDGQTGFVAVSDSGPGVDPSEQKKIFQRFYRTESSRSSPGNGLGLALVEAVARLHHAEIRLSENHPGLRIAILFLNANTQS